MSLRHIAILTWTLAIAGCGFPAPPDAVACAADGSCPAGQHCEADLRCHPTVSTMDASDDADPGSPIDAAPDSQSDAPIDRRRERPAPRLDARDG